jgi:hypothetical protein
MPTFVLFKNDVVARMRTAKNKPAEEWIQVPDNWRGDKKDKRVFFDSQLNRIDDAVLIDRGIRIDNRGVWFNKSGIGKTKIITELDEEIDTSQWTKEKPLENEYYQKWDEPSGAFVVDVERKEAAEKERAVGEKKAAIVDAEQRIQRSLIAKEMGTATPDDEQYFNAISAEILSLRSELQQLLAL